MKISIGSKVVEGPWGGGNLFVKNLANFLTNQGWDVFFDLTEPDLDIILLTDPRSKFSSSSTFNHKDIKLYKKLINNRVKVVHRINECDERKNTIGVNEYYLKASKVADSVIFVSSWLRSIYTNLGMDISRTKVILAGADKSVFNSDNLKTWNKKEKLKIVTHHWSNHKNKGFEDYQKIDELLHSEYWSKIIEFTYIGNLNKNYKLNKTKTLSPMSGLELASELKTHHFYFTASINEPSGNHHIEASQCGLPVIFKNSGGIPEYCEGFGVGYSVDLENAINEALKNYDKYLEAVKKYPLDAEKMSLEFLKHFKDLISEEKTNNINKKVFKKFFISYFIIQKYIVLIILSSKNKVIKILKILVNKI